MKKISIDKFYVSPVVMIGRNKYNHEGFIARLKSVKKIIITGTAGLGKSIYLKRLSIYYSKSSHHPLPVFLELRDLNDKKPNIEDAIFKTINTPDEFLTRKQFEYALKEGMICIFLDAFDEIDNDIRTRYEKEIFELCARFPDTQLVVTSRPSPDEGIEGWGLFEHAILQPFDLPRVIDLIDRLDEEPHEKQKFNNLVSEKLFATHESFLSTPLLALIMFLTYQTGAQIPDKLHEFYHRAFEALYYRHDTQKGHYSRKSYTSLNRDEFLRIVSCFCAITYFDRSISLLERDLRHKIEEAKKIESINCDTQDLINDLIESICMMQRDGSEIAFTHRSFQEYFTAIYILTSEVLETFSVINQLIYRQGFDNVVKMIGEMNREFIERKWVLKWLGLYYEKVNKISCLDDFGIYCKYLRYQGLLFNKEGDYIFSLSGSSDNIGAVNVILTHLYEKDYLDSNSFRNLDGKEFEKEQINLAKYFINRDGLKIPRKKAERTRVYQVNITEKDRDIFKNTQYSMYFEGQRRFLIDLKKKIEERHRAKGEGFMGMIRGR